MPDHSWWQILTIVGGTLIVVQGFETSRYLQEEFDTDTRIRIIAHSQQLGSGHAKHLTLHIKWPKTVSKTVLIDQFSP